MSGQQKEIGEEMNSRTELLELLLERVRKMRESQKEFFMYRSRPALAESKAAERLVDDLLAQIDTQASEECSQ